MAIWGRLFLTDLLAHKAGNTLPMAAAGLLVSAAIVGSGVDMSRAYRAENRLQSACDAAVLAGRKAVSTNGFDQNARDEAETYFTANFEDASQETEDSNFVATSADDGGTVEGTASATIDTAIMKIFGYDQFELSVDCTASMGVGNSDIMMVLDTTGSMGGSRIAALRTAMKNFYDTLQQSVAGTNARVRYGFVPYSQSVNVGHLLDPDWIVDEYSYASRRPHYDLQIVNVFDHWDDPVYSSTSGNSNQSSGNWSEYSSTRYRRRSDCEDDLPNDSAWQDYGSSTTSTSTQIVDGQQIEIVSTTQPQWRTVYECQKDRGRYYQYRGTGYRDHIENEIATSDAVYTQEERQVFDEWEYDQVLFDTSRYKTFAPTAANILTSGTDSGPPSAVTSTWSGCIVERATVNQSSFSYSSMMGLSPSGALDLDIDLAPDASDDATRWAPMWPDISYRRWSGYDNYTTSATSNGSYVGDTAVCPVQSQLLAEMDETAFDAYADSLVPRGNTYHDVGMIWGGRLISPTGIFAENVNAAPANGAEVSRHIVFMTDGEMKPSNSITATYGVERNEHRVTSDGRSSDSSRHTARFLAVCQQIKAKGIRIWVIAFGTGLTSDLQTCSSAQSSFTANDGAQLDAAFQEIAKQVGELRVIQ